MMGDYTIQFLHCSVYQADDIVNNMFPSTVDMD